MADWSLLNKTPDFVGQAQNAFLAGQDMAMQRDRKAILATASDDPARAQNAMLGIGDIQTANQLQGYQNNQQLGQQRQTQFDQGQVDRVKGQVLQTAQALRSLPMEQRGQAYLANAVPLLQQLKVPDAEIQRVMADGHLTDEELDSFIQQFGGELERVQSINMGNGGVAAYNPNRTGANALSVLREPEPDVNGDLERQLLEARIRATDAQVGQRQASAERSRRTPAGRRSGGGSASVPAGFVLD